MTPLMSNFIPFKPLELVATNMSDLGIWMQLSYGVMNGEKNLKN
jgi:hypothetical protein